MIRVNGEYDVCQFKRVVNCKKSRKCGNAAFNMEKKEKKGRKKREKKVLIFNTLFALYNCKLFEFQFLFLPTHFDRRVVNEMIVTLLIGINMAAKIGLNSPLTAK